MEQDFEHVDDCAEDVILSMKDFNILMGLPFM